MLNPTSKILILLDHGSYRSLEFCKQWVAVRTKCLKSPRMVPGSESALRTSSFPECMEAVCSDAVRPFPHQTSNPIPYRYMYIKTYIFKRYYLLILRETGREGETEREKHGCVVASHTPPNGDLVCNPAMCPNWDWANELLVHRLALNPLSHTSQS